MNWELHRQKLEDGKEIRITPKGNSMVPIIHSGDTVIISPTKQAEKGDVVFCRVKGNYYIHKVSAIKQDRYQISNNFGRMNGWTKQIFGKVIKIKRK